MRERRFLWARVSFHEMSHLSLVYESCDATYKVNQLARRRLRWVTPFQPNRESARGKLVQFEAADN